jgi:hypothetical protein
MTANVEWRLMALAAISEGFCPEHKTPLDPQPLGGWCPACSSRGCWWTIRNGDTVVSTYPHPALNV